MSPGAPSAPGGGRLAGKRALVTGGGTGVGRAIAQAFAAEGAAVAVVGRRGAPLAEVGRGIAAIGGRCVEVVADVADPEAIDDAVLRVSQALGGLDVLVNNAGVYEPLSAVETNVETWDRLLAINLRGPFLLARAGFPHLARSRGVVLNISSTLGLRPIPASAAYCVSKAGLDMLTRVLALEWAGHGIRANSIVLGIVDTPIHDARKGDDPVGWLKEVNGMQPLGRVGQPTDVAGAAVYLASDAAGWVTGALLTVDGGIALA